MHQQSPSIPFQSDPSPESDPLVFQEFLKKARDAAFCVIHKNISARGLAASIDNYPQIWARDTVITFLGATANDETALDAFRISLECLGEHQDRFGQIPNQIKLANNQVLYGSCDPTLWYVVGCCIYAERTGNAGWLERSFESVRLALEWGEMRDFTKCGLICSMEADDWADLMCHHGHVLFANALRVLALKRAGAAYAQSHPETAEGWTKSAERACAASRERFWVNSPNTFTDKTHTQVRTQMSIRLRSLPYFLPWVNLFEFGERFDAPGNLLAILTGVATPEQAQSILDYIRQEGIDTPYPVRVIHPVIRPNEKDWRDYYMVWGHGQPYHYQNGGIWPWVGGLYVTALVKCRRFEQARKALLSLAEAISLGKDEEWECNEWLHGQSGNPMGAKFQAWSAGMFLYAYQCVMSGEVPDFA